MKLRRVLLWAVTVFLFSGCRRERAEPTPEVTYVELQPLFESACVECHGDDEPEGGWRASSHWEIIGCNAAGDPVTRPASSEAPLLQVLSRPDHASLWSEDAQRAVHSWVLAGAPAFTGSVHPPGIMDPRSEDWHGVLSAQDGWGPLVDPAHAVHCGLCHAGAPTEGEGSASVLPEATNCTACHRDPEGVYACSTCHGRGTRGYPPREACYFERAGEGGAHAAHLDALSARAEPLSCDACHPVPKQAELLSSSHANGKVEVRFAAALAGDTASFDSATQRCSVACHARGGSDPEPRWRADAEALDCGSCHASPPEDHYAGSCNDCHVEMGVLPDSLMPGPLHLNGRVDIGDGSGGCSACHGAGALGWPQDAAHRVHQQTQLTEAVRCGECHSVPESVDAAGHLDGVLDVAFSGRAVRGDATPRFEAGSCRDVACHGAWLQAPAPAPRWDAPRAGACRSCHGAPPPPPHVADSGCSALSCHGELVAEWPDGARITSRGRASHIDGMISAGP